MESVIAYTDRLWRSLDRPKPSPRRRAGSEIVGRLAPWVATLTRFDRDYVIAVAHHSGLSLVFETASVERFKPAMIAALRAVFEDMGLPAHALPAEVSDIESACYVRQRDPLVRDELDFLAEICASELPYFPGNLRRVQLNLNEFPRQRQIPCEPSLAAPLLFGMRSGSATVH